jgi:hypothetical protein
LVLEKNGGVAGDVATAHCFTANTPALIYTTFNFLRTAANPKLNILFQMKADNKSDYTITSTEKV